MPLGMIGHSFHQEMFIISIKSTSFFGGIEL